MTIYQVFTRLFGADSNTCSVNGTASQNGCGKMNDFTAKALHEICSLGCTHVWYTGIIEHATQADYSKFGIRPDHPDVVKGRAGSPYAIKDYYDVDPDLAVNVNRRMREFESLVKRTHEAGLGVIIDFVPNHVSRQYHSDAMPEGVRDLGQDDDTGMSFSTANNFYYIPGEPLHFEHILDGSTYSEFPAKATGNDVFNPWPERNDWYETVKLNYGIDVQAGRRRCFTPVPDTWVKMLQILLFWSSKGIDGFRCDMAEMVTVEFWQWVIPQVKRAYPGILFIAEVYDPSRYRSYIYEGHFDYLYDKVGLYDTLKAVVQGHASAHAITHAWQAVDDIRSHMLCFLENHDEQRLASDFFAADPSKGRAPLLASALMYPNPMMVYFGQELGERGMDQEGFSGRDGRTTIFDYWTVDTIRRWRDGGRFSGRLLTDEERSLREFYSKVLALREGDPLFCEGEFFDLMYVCPSLQRQYAFARHHGDALAIVLCNFSGEETHVNVHMPQHLFDTWCVGMVKDAPVVELLTGRQLRVNLDARLPLSVTLPPYGGMVLKYVYPGILG